jgi:hypothetical protein
MNLLQPLDTASARMQTSTFGKSKSLWATLTEGSWSEAYAGIGASLILVSNPAIQVPHHENFVISPSVVNRGLKICVALWVH